MLEPQPHTTSYYAASVNRVTDLRAASGSRLSTNSWLTQIELSERLQHARIRCVAVSESAQRRICLQLFGPVEHHRV